ncbi:polymer-forming cytoskeletal protein [Marinobacter sp. M216]|uniref:Polymer-forming cytoskeletal protein n=1 Tax=Marinobacter albus TaxID=3030833 RepID=A0ABT7HEX0_9GAMM|nr:MULTISPECIES: polymer-forming cytoskeletal protein [unclassified Marinobacter]MBW7472367.1 polymer-forming cytoskeletal protein [Marinobacter sp. F4218]MDK9558917.1 polymer-forming cytoskeletal protein [Marinobacter sp. M216]
MLGKKKQKPRRPTGHFDTLISSRTTVEGDVQFSGGLHVDGKVHGKVVAEEGSDAVLRISEIGEIAGDIVAPHVIINGTVHGDVYASAHLELAEKASINGNVYYNLIEMAMGASVNGNLVHQREPAGLLTQDKPRVKSESFSSDDRSVAAEAEAEVESGGKSE